MSERRSVLQAIAGLSIATLVAGVGLPVAFRKMFDDAQGLGILFIRSGEIVTISSDDSETYDAIVWEQSGTLNWEEGGSIQLADTA